MARRAKIRRYRRRSAATKAGAGPAGAQVSPFAMALEGGFDRLFGGRRKRGRRSIEGLSVDQILEQAPSQGKRCPKSKQTELDQAADVTKRINTTTATTAETAAYFPAIKKRFRLKSIGYKNLGEGGAGIELEVNPKATIDASGLLQGTPGQLKGSGGPALKTRVQFGPAHTEDGLTIGGTDMLASALGPDHPEGSHTSPGGEMQPVMDKLPKKKFVKGHLLNANLGGPGADARNLFPITYSANSYHYHRMEKSVRDQVNTSDYWMKYHVGISNIQVVAAPQFLINAQLDAQANYIDQKGQPTGQGFSLSVQSALDATSVLKSGRLPRGEHGARHPTGATELPAGATGDAILSQVARVELWKAYQVALTGGNAAGSEEAYRATASKFGYGLEKAVAFVIPKMGTNGENPVKASGVPGRAYVQKLNENVTPSMP